MKVAFHFNADDPSIQGKGGYGLNILKRFFSALREGDRDATAHVKVWHGLYGAFEYGRTPQSRAAIEAALLKNDQRLWRDIDVPLFLSRAFTPSIYVIVVEGLAEPMRDQIHAVLKPESSYYGALQVFEAIPEHWRLYHRGLVPRYRYFCGQLRIFYTADEEESRDTGLEPYWIKSELFSSVVWENVSLRYSFLESRDDFEDAQKLAELDRMLPDEVSVMADDILLRLRDERPQLCDTLYAACERLRAVTTRNSEEAAHSAASCRRFLKFLADYLYPPRAEKVDGYVVDDEHFINRFYAYMKAHLAGDKDFAQEDLDELDKAIKALNNDSSKGVHAHISTAELDSIIRRLVTFTYRVLQLASPPLTLPGEPYDEVVQTLLFAKHDPVHATEYADLLGLMCPVCGGRMEGVSGQSEIYLRCVNYPKCQSQRSMDELD